MLKYTYRDCPVFGEDFTSQPFGSLRSLAAGERMALSLPKGACRKIPILRFLLTNLP